MDRRRLIRDGATLLAATVPLSRLLFGDEARASIEPRPGALQPFDYAVLKGLARSRAEAPYQPPNRNLPPRIAKLDWDQWQSIRFRKERSIWGNEDLPFIARFFHLGFTMKTPVRIYEVANGVSREIGYDPGMFDYGKSDVHPGDTPSDLGFAGFNLLFHTDWARDRVAFQGASYFRAVDGGRQFGMSQRGLAVDCGLPRPEEFPDFIAFYLERPVKGSDSMTVYGLLDSASVTGAYRFVIRPADTLVMDVDAAVYPRKEIERIGIAPGTSMFFYGKNNRLRSDDWRPEIHDSDGLQMWTGAGEWIWRPLINPNTVRVNSFTDEQPRGFGLIQRERDFEQYQDDSVYYEKRPDVWVEPKGNWGKGSVMLVEIPTRDETSDNIVAFWTPADKPQRGEEYLYGYRLYWGPENPFFKAGRVFATRTGIGGVVGRDRKYFSWRFVVDFAGGSLASLGEKAEVVAAVTASRGRVETLSARPLVPGSTQASSSVPQHGWRAMFDFVPTDDSLEPVNFRLFLSLDGQALTETWLYQYEPPTPDQRKALMTA